MAIGEYRYAVNQHAKSFHDRPSKEYRTFFLFLRHENPSICILGVHHAVLVVSVMVVVEVVVDMLDCSVDTHHCSLGLSPFDDKQYILDDGINSLAYGHWRI
jgi:hypothetical protein